MSMRAALIGALLAAGGTSGALAIELPPVCANDPLPLDTATPLAELRKQVEALNETDPTQAVRLMCMAIPRAQQELGADSVDLAWWVGALATPLIAYMDQLAEAIPLLQFAQPILERHYGEQGEQVADIHIAYGWIYQRQRRLAESAAAWERALAIRERHPGARKIELQKALVGLALVRLQQSEFAASRAALTRASAILEEQGETVSEAAAAIENVFTNLSFREENYLEAKQHAERQIAIEKQLQTGIGQFVPAYVYLAQILERLDDFAGSEAASREAIRLAESDTGPLQRHQLTALTQLSNLLLLRGRPAEALPVAERAVQLGETTVGANAPRLITPLQILADSHRALGQLSQAMHIYERIGAIVAANRADIERPVLVAYYRGLGHLQLELGNLDDAVSTLNAGLAVTDAESGLVLERAYIMATLAQAGATRDAAHSATQLMQAQSLFASRVPRSHPAMLRVINERCALEIHAGNRRAPNCAAAQARAGRTREVDPALRAAVLGNLSELARLRGDTRRANEWAIAAVAAAEGLGTPDPLWRAYYHTARALSDRGEARLAIFFGKRSVAQIESLRGQLRGEDERFDRTYLRDKSNVYRTVADWLMEAGRIDEGLEVLRLLKQEELHEFVRDSARREDDVTFDTSETRLNDEYSSALPSPGEESKEIEALTRLQDKSRLTDAERRRLAELLRRQGGSENARTRRLKRFIAENSGEQQTVQERAIQATRLQRELDRAPAGSALAVYLLTEDKLRILVATRTSQIEKRIALDGQRLQRDIGRYIEGIGRREDVRDLGRSLYERVGIPLDELARRERVDRIVLWLDGALRYLPFYALPTPDGYLGERYAMQLLALHDDAASHATPAATAPIVRGLGVTQAVAGFDALPAMADELCYIVRGPIAGLATHSSECPEPANARGAITGEGFADAEFTAERLQTVLAAPRAFSVLHLGTHFSLRPGNAMRSFLVLGDGSRLMLDKISTFDFSGLDLVTLSACQTGLGGGRTDDGREIDGLNALVQERGARKVIASLWRVDDASTAQLMRSLYQALAANDGDAAVALQAAQRSIRRIERGGRRPYEHPYYWAGFVLSDRGP